MEAWKIIFLSKWVIFRFHVNLPGRTSETSKWLNFQMAFSMHLRNLQGQVPERLEGKGACCTFPAAVVGLNPGATGDA